MIGLAFIVAKGLVTVRASASVPPQPPARAAVPAAGATIRLAVTKSNLSKSVSFLVRMHLRAESRPGEI